MQNHQIVLASWPQGFPTVRDFRIETVAPPEPRPGEVLVETLYLTVDPYMRGLLREGGSGYLGAVEPGQVMRGEGVGRVIQSASPDFAPGDIVSGMTNWQSHAALPVKGLRRIDPAIAPISTALGVLGMPGLTAYFGLLDICQPKPGETVVVSGAAGAVGSIAGQIAKIHGCRVVGIAGGAAKCDWLTGELGFDAALDYKTTAHLRRSLQALCPDGIDCYFDNVGGVITDAALMLIRDGARISICGQIAQYNATEAEMGPRLLFQLIVRQARMEGFLVMKYFARAREAYAAIGQWIREGRLKYRETIVEGLENTPRAFIGLFGGENTGKMVVKVAD
jgi:NADPH-dependent curcumin reductase CurA